MTSLGCDRERLESAVDSSAGRELYVESAPVPCPRPAPVSARAADTVMLDDAEPYPCRIRFRETGIVLRGDSAGGWPDPGENIARDSRGRFFSTILGVNSEIAVWNRDGTFDRTLGGEGQGPGELPKTTFPPLVFVDAGDSLRVRSQDGVWSTWDPELRFVRLVRLPRRAGGNYTAHVWLRSGAVITVPSNSGHHFLFAAADGKDSRTFGPVSPQIRALEMEMVQRAIAASGDTAFWAGPVAYAGQGYVMELWSTNDRPLRTYRRTASWFRTGEPEKHFGRDAGTNVRRPCHALSPRR